MQYLIQHVQQACTSENLTEVPVMNIGDTLSVHIKIQERGKERIQQFEGTLMNIKGKKETIRTITVRKLSSGVAVERIFPIPAPYIARIEVKRKAIVRRANLSYLRKRSTTSRTKLKYKIK